MTGETTFQTVIDQEIAPDLDKAKVRLRQLLSVEKTAASLALAQELFTIQYDSKSSSFVMGLEAIGLDDQLLDEKRPIKISKQYSHNISIGDVCRIIQEVGEINQARTNELLP